MKPETEQLLGTLEVLSYNPFFWNTEVKGDFNILKLLQDYGFLQLTDIEVAITNWLSIENSGWVVESHAPDKSERENISDEETQKKRENTYQSIKKLLTSNLNQLQAFNISPKSYDYWEWSDASFSFDIILGQSKDSDWFCICPTVPNEISYYKYQNNSKIFHKSYREKAISQNSISLKLEIENLINQLKPITIYGYYGGGYDYTYQHKILCTATTSKASAITKALCLSNMLLIHYFDEYSLDNYFTGSFDADNLELAKFLDNNLKDINIYELCFWDLSYQYLIGKAETGDYLGIKSSYDLEYNP